MQSPHLVVFLPINQLPSPCFVVQGSAANFILFKGVTKPVLCEIHFLK